MKLNCWEFMQCGLEPGGVKTAKSGDSCPVPLHQAYNGVHDGKRAGRACWAVPASLCAGEQQGVYNQKAAHCRSCDFFKEVMKEEEKSQYGFAQHPATMPLYLRRRNLTSRGGVPVFGGKIVNSSTVGEVERKYYSFAGDQGKSIIDTVFIEIKYRRGMPMPESHFKRLIDTMKLSLYNGKQAEFENTISNVFIAEQRGQ